MDPKSFKQHEMKVNCASGLLGGVVGAFLTNALESITVQKQIDPTLNITKMVREQGPQLLTRGLLARVYYNGAYSLLFFSLVL